MPKTPKKPDPTDFTQEKADEICNRLIDGESLRSICLSAHMPSPALVCKWLANDEAFREQYARAREAQADTLADEILDIADDGSNDWMDKKSADGDVIGQEYNGDAVARSKLRVDSRKWIASKLRPKVYGEKQETTVKVGLDDETKAWLDARGL